jgi:hypothetical protein
MLPFVSPPNTCSNTSEEFDMYIAYTPVLLGLLIEKSAFFRAAANRRKELRFAYQAGDYVFDKAFAHYGAYPLPL